MKSKYIAISLFILVTIFYDSPAQDREAEADQAAFKTVHMFNLKPEFSVADLQIILERFNALFVQLDHPDSQYRLWEVSEEKEGGVRYFWESTWSSKSLYDEIHMNEAYRKLFNEAFVEIAKMFQDHTYTQYYEIPVNDADEPVAKLSE